MIVKYLSDDCKGALMKDRYNPENVAAAIFKME